MISTVILVRVANSDAAAMTPLPWCLATLYFATEPIAIVMAVGLRVFASHAYLWVLPCALSCRSQSWIGFYFTGPSLNPFVVRRLAWHHAPHAAPQLPPATPPPALALSI